MPQFPISLNPNPVGPVTPWMGNDRNEWFPVKITGTVASGGSLGLTRDGYTGYELWINAAGTASQVAGGRVMGLQNPGIPLDTTMTLEADDLALARMAPGAGGLRWELAPYQGTENTICFEVVTAVSCDGSGNLVVTTSYVHITGIGLSVTVDSTAC